MNIQPLAGALLAAAALVQRTPAPAISMMKPATGAAADIEQEGGAA